MRTRPDADDAELNGGPEPRDGWPADAWRPGDGAGNGRLERERRGRRGGRGERGTHGTGSGGDKIGGAARRGGRGGNGSGAAGRPWRRARRAVVALAVLAAVGTGLWSVPSVHGLLRQSFTELPTTYTELSFTSAPSVTGADLSVPVTIVAHASPTNSVALKVWLTNAAGAAETPTSVAVQVNPHSGVAKTVVTLQTPADAQIVWVGVPGQTGALHYRIAGSAIPTASASPS